VIFDVPAWLERVGKPASQARRHIFLQRQSPNSTVPLCLFAQLPKMINELPGRLTQGLVAKRQISVIGIFFEGFYSHCRYSSLDCLDEADRWSMLYSK